MKRNTKRVVAVATAWALTAGILISPLDSTTILAAGKKRLRSRLQTKSWQRQR